MKKLLSGIILLLSIFSFCSCEKKENENVFEKELTGPWNYQLEQNIIYHGQSQSRDAYSGTISFHNDNTFEYKLEPGYNLDTKGTWKVVGNQVYMYFYSHFHEYDGLYDIIPVEGGIDLYLIYKEWYSSAISVKLKLTK